MRLSRFPRPEGDTGIAFRYFPDTQHYGREDLNRWLSQLQAMGASWLILHSTLAEVIPEFFLRELLEHKVEPVVHMGAPCIGPLDGVGLSRLLRQYASYGLRYLYFYSEPNMVMHWSPIDWGRPDLVEGFLDLLLPCLDRAVEAGLYPLFPPLEPGGHYWDTAFLASSLGYLRDREKGYLFDRMGVAIRNPTLQRNLNWGKGGSRQWRGSLPYCTPPGAEDHCGFFLFEWYDEIIRPLVGASLPLLSVNGGITLGGSDGEGFSQIEESSHAEGSLEICRMLREGELPDYLFCQSLGLLASGGDPRYEEEAWFKADGGRLPAVEALRGMEKHPRLFSWDRPPVPNPIVYPKPMYHYLLFGSWEDAVAEKEWASAERYLKRFRPSCGFSVEDAMQAEYVTIVGDSLSVSPQVERMIRAAGCKVERVAGGSPRETKKILDGLVASGMRFLNF